MNYQLGDFVIRIKNAKNARRKVVPLPYSKINMEVGKVLVRENFLDDIKMEEKDGKKMLRGKIAYEKRQPVLSEVLLISKPGLRVYIRKTRIRNLERKKMSTLIISTSKGVMTGKEAQKKGLGGELLFEVS